MARAKVHGNGHVVFEYCQYSVPFRLIGQSLWLEITAQVLRAYHEHELVATHRRCTRPGERSTVEDHLPPQAQAYFLRDPQWCLAQARAVGPACLALVEALFAHRVLDHLRAAQGVLRLTEGYSRARLEAACARALAFGTPTYRTVKHILKHGLDQAPELFDPAPLEEPYLGGGRFSRGPADALH
ncbi:MAG: hypothetical protein KF778_23125 [Rhodocyclaceae bacterium]|nr:hypothetical protein [Rhodocyclaceae bacterium]